VVYQRLEFCVRRYFVVIVLSFAAFEIRLISDSSGEKKEKSSADSQLVQIGEPKVNFIGETNKPSQLTLSAIQTGIIF
jgi:hypothetical protein